MRRTAIPPRCVRFLPVLLAWCSSSRFGSSASRGLAVFISSWRGPGRAHFVRRRFSVLCLGLAGCSLFGKKNSAADTSTRTSTGGGGTARPGTPVADTAPAPSLPNGLLAGQVLDSFNRRASGVLIQVVDLQDPKGMPQPTSKSRRTRPATSLFRACSRASTISLFIARVKDGDHLLSGNALATPPNPRMSIVVNEDFTSATTPALPTPAPLRTRVRAAGARGPAATIQPPRGRRRTGRRGQHQSPARRSRIPRRSSARE